MTELAAPVTLAIAVSAGLCFVVSVLAFVLMRRAMTRAAKAERRLATLFSDIEDAVGERIDRSQGGSWREQVSQSLKRLAGEARAAASLQNAKADPDWVEIAEQALSLAAGTVETLPQASESAQVAASLRLAERIAATRESLSALSANADLEGALESGALNDLLTTEPLLAAYFGRDPALVPVSEGYRLAGSAVRFALSERRIRIEAPAPLSIVSGAEARQDTVDGRELRRLPAPRALANRMAARLLPGESLVVYPMVPGWTTPDYRRAPVVAVWNRASWLN